MVLERCDKSAGRCHKNDGRVSHEFYKGVGMGLEWCWKVVTREITRVLQECYKGVGRVGVGRT
jgi:hypothetical protein